MGQMTACFRCLRFPEGASWGRAYRLTIVAEDAGRSGKVILSRAVLFAFICVLLLLLALFGNFGLLAPPATPSTFFPSVSRSLLQCVPTVFPS